jgi:hypothetical protein
MSEDEKEHLQREKEADEARKTEFNVGLVRHPPPTHSLGHVQTHTSRGPGLEKWMLVVVYPS